MLTVTPIKDNDNLLNTINSHIKLRKLKEVMLLCRIIKLLSISSADANVREEGNKNYSSLYYSDSNSDTATKKTRIKAYSLLDSDDYCLDSSLDINSKDNLEDEEATIAKDLLTTVYSANKQTRIRDSLSARLTGAYILYFKELLSNNSRIFASVIGITRTRAIKNEVVAIDPVNSILCNLSDLLVVRFCIFSNSALENIGILINKKVVEMQTDTATALANKLAAVNKLVRLQTFILKILEYVETIILEANMPAMHSKAMKHYLALLAAQFIIVCSFRKVDKHMFRAYNTISVIAQRTIIRKGSPYIEKKIILLSSYVTFNATNKRDSVTSDRIYKIEDVRNIIANVKHNASEHKLSYKDILKKEGLNKSEASRRFKTYSSCKVKRFTLNSVKDLFTNLSKDYFLSIAVEDAAKAANTLLLLKEVCAKILIGSYKPIVQAIIVASIAFAEAIILIEATHVLAEMCVGIIYFNSDSKLELKVLGKQDVKTTS
ncbi:hypothetical protein HBH51_069920 [Parastagonospora nodorum]|nr:hypothetical protein HBH51_069920 [Parastagonospora nodorum]